MDFILKSSQIANSVTQSLRAAVFLIAILGSCLASAQKTASPDPVTPPAHMFHDARSGVSFQIPVGWNLSVKDGDVSTFRLDGRSAVRTTRMHALASIAFNPYPESTFSGAFFYLSLTPHLPPVDCARQATVVDPRVASIAQVGGVSFQHGYDEHGGVCTEARDEIYTASRNGNCTRFDLILNSFCGGDVSGVRDITAAQIEAIRHRLEAILATVHFDE